MTRRWAPPKPKSPQTELRLTDAAAAALGRGRFTPPVKTATDTSAAAASDAGIGARGKEFADVGNLAAAMVGVLGRHAARVKLSGVMLAVAVRKEVMEWLGEHREGATADEIAAAIGRGILTVRPRVSELNRRRLIVDSGARRANAVSGKRAIVWRLS